MRLLFAALITCGFVMMPGIAGAVGPDKVVIAHRGASAYLPEHTLEAYAMAYGQGAHYIEPDLVLTRDRVPISVHDRTLDATTNVAEVFPGRAREDGHHYAIDFTLAEIKQLAVHERVNPKAGRPVFPARFPNRHRELVFRIPTLVEVIELVQGLNHASGKTVGIFPETKHPHWHVDQGYYIERILLEVLTRYGYRAKDDPVMIQSFEATSLLRLRELGSELRLVQVFGGGSGSQEMITPAGLDRIAEYADGIGPAIELLIDKNGKLVNDNALVTAAQARALKVYPWTLRADSLPSHTASFDVLARRLFFELGVDGIFTDHPDLLVRTLPQR